ncbi:MAG: tetratricopeptide (TPR) repeat protein, partial [Bacteroidia bacterium]
MNYGQDGSKPDSLFGKQKTILLVLVVVALASVFLLPQFVSKPWILDGSVDDRQVPDTSALAVSPSTAAEKTQYRQEAQSLLAKIIPIRDKLKLESVEVWSPVEYQIALGQIDDGDDKYSYGDYRESLESYQLALSGFETLDQLGQQKLSDSLSSGFEAIENLNVTGATVASELATVIAGQNEQVRELASRAISLPAVAEQLEKGDLEKSKGNPLAAQDAYQQAVSLDPLHKRAVESLAAIKSEIIENNFRQHMSRAYAALDQSDYDTAIAAFEQAGLVHPGHPAIAQGMAQLENNRSLLTVSSQIAQAAELEVNEDWAEAVAVYENLLQEDPTLTEAKVKLIPSKVRADLDQRLIGFNEDPLKLSEPRVFRQAQVTINDAKGIPNPGSRLEEQINHLQTLLKRAVTSVDVEFQSDNVTQVTLFRVAQLGQFDRTSLTLKPGKYIAAGTRQGYRDVRIEFSITGEPLDAP